MREPDLMRASSLAGGPSRRAWLTSAWVIEVDDERWILTAVDCGLAGAEGRVYAVRLYFAGAANDKLLPDDLEAWCPLLPPLVRLRCELRMPQYLEGLLQELARMMVDGELDPRAGQDVWAERKTVAMHRAGLAMGMRLVGEGSER